MFKRKFYLNMNNQNIFSKKKKKKKKPNPYPSNSDDYFSLCLYHCCLLRILKVSHRKPNKSSTLALLKGIMIGRKSL